jgi:hypothetical protein
MRFLIETSLSDGHELLIHMGAQCTSLGGDFVRQIGVATCG